MEVNATTPSIVSSVSVKISPDVTPGGDQVVSLDAEQNEGKVNFIAAEGTKKNPQKWVVKKRESQIGDLDQHKLKAIVLHNGIGREIHMTQAVGFVTAYLETTDLVT